MLHLLEHGAATTTPLFYYYNNGAWKHVIPSDITKTLRFAVRLIGPITGFLPKYVSAVSLCTTSMMTLLNAHMDGVIICLIINWHSDTMLCYLHVLAVPVIKNFAPLIVWQVNYDLHSNHEVPLS